MNQKATQKGAHPDEVSEEAEKALAEAKNATIEAKVSDISDLAKQHRETRNAELKEAGHEVTDTTQEPEDEQEESEEETADEKEEVLEKPDTEEKAEEKAEKKEFDTLIVDGQEQKVDRDKIYDAGKRTLQKESAADKRLAEATEMLRKAEETMAKAQKPLPDKDEDTPALSDPDVKTIAKQLVDGDVDDVEEAISKLMQGRQPSTPNISETDIRAAVSDQLAVAKAMETFKTPVETGGYGDLYENPTLQKMVFDKEAELAKHDQSVGAYRSPMERLKEAAESVRSFRDELTGTKPASKPEGFEDLQTKKQQAESTPEGTGTRATRTGASEAKPLTAEQKQAKRVNDMAKARGQNLE